MAGEGSFRVLAWVARRARCTPHVARCAPNAAPLSRSSSCSPSHLQEADFFYVPVYTSCVINPIADWGPGPFYHMPGTPPTTEQRRGTSCLCVRGLPAFTRPLFPHRRRHRPGAARHRDLAGRVLLHFLPVPFLGPQGRARPHLCTWLREDGCVAMGCMCIATASRTASKRFADRRQSRQRHPSDSTCSQFVSHDEASCWIPNEIRPAIILSHWGRTDPDHTSWTSYGARLCCLRAGRFPVGGAAPGWGAALCADFLYACTPQCSFQNLSTHKRHCRGR